jgi:hypothetical protein
MPPGQNISLFFVVRVVVPIIVRVLVPVRRMVVMRVLAFVIMRAVCMIIVLVTFRRARLRDRADRTPSAKEPATKQPGSQEYEQRITYDLDDADRITHHFRRGADQRGGDAYDDNGRDGLQQCGSKRQYHAASPGFLVGDDVGRDDRFAVTGAGGVKNAVDERNAYQSPQR